MIPFGTGSCSARATTSTSALKIVKKFEVSLGRVGLAARLGFPKRAAGETKSEFNDRVFEYTQKKKMYNEEERAAADAKRRRESEDQAEAERTAQPQYATGMSIDGYVKKLPPGTRRSTAPTRRTGNCPSGSATGSPPPRARTRPTVPGGRDRDAPARPEAFQASKRVAPHHKTHLHNLSTRSRCAPSAPFWRFEGRTTPATPANRETDRAAPRKPIVIGLEFAIFDQFGPFGAPICGTKPIPVPGEAAGKPWRSRVAAWFARFAPSWLFRSVARGTWTIDSLWRTAKMLESGWNIGA